MILDQFLSKLPWNLDKNCILEHAHSNLPAGQINKQLIEGTLLNAAYKEARRYQGGTPITHPFA